MQNPPGAGPSGDPRNAPTIAVPAPHIAAPPPVAPPPLPVEPARRGLRLNRTLVIAAVLVVTLLAITGGAAFAVNASLSSTYSPERALTDYFAAQKRGDVSGMMANATFLRGDGSFAEFFGEAALTGMLSLPENLEIEGVRVTSMRDVDGSTQVVTAAMRWHGTERTAQYTVRKDPTQLHYGIYSSWRVDIPAEAITIKHPPQGGTINLDGIPLPEGAMKANSIQTIQGFHKVDMDPSFLYDGASQLVDVSMGMGTVIFNPSLAAKAKTAAAAAVAAGFKACNPSAYRDCFNHTYYSPVSATLIYYLTLPGYPEIDFTRYVLTLTKDPTTTMSLEVTSEPGVLNVGGPCAATLTVDGTRHYYFKGRFTGTLAVTNDDAFSADITWNCLTAKA